MSGEIGGVPSFLLIAFVLANCWAFTRIFSKAGFHWAWGLFSLIPVIGFFVPIFLAIVDWPNNQAGRDQDGQTGEE